MSRPFGSADELERRRHQAVRAVQQGESPEAVARVLGIHRSSIYRRLRLADQPEGLAAKPHPGPTPRLSAQQQHHLLDLLRQGDDAHGWTNRLWTTRRIAELIRRSFAIRLHHDHVGRFLRTRLDWTPEKPERRARNAHAEDLVAYLQLLKQQVRGPLTVIWDGSNIHSKSKVVRAYLAEHPEIVVATLPGYSPDLNPDEQVWGWTKYGQLANLAAEDNDQLRDAVISKLVELREDPFKLQAFV